MIIVDEDLLTIIDMIKNFYKFVFRILKEFFMKKYLRTFWLLFFFGTLFLQAQQSLSFIANSYGVSMNSPDNIAIATVGETVNSEISPVAGRSPYYLIFDENGVLLKSIKNSALSRGRSASSIVVDLLLKESCKIVIAGQFGDNMQNQLKANDIEYFEREGIASEVLQTFIKKQKK
jgi:predicted Fe-Mo cluster-binding NifX family protein